MLFRKQVNISIVRVIQHSHEVVHENATEDYFVEVRRIIDARPVRGEQHAALAEVHVVY